MNILYPVSQSLELELLKIGFAREPPPLQSHNGRR